EAMSDEIIGSQPLSIGLATHPSSSDDFAVLTGPREESRDYEQLGQREVVNGIHSPIFGHKCGRRKGRPSAICAPCAALGWREAMADGCASNLAVVRQNCQHHRDRKP